MTNDEILMTKECRNPNDQNGPNRAFLHSSLGLGHSFVIRHSSFVIPSTVVVVHPKEKRKKCTAEPLRSREGFWFWEYPSGERPSFDGYVRLGLAGPVLGQEDSESGLLVLDGTWRHVSHMECDFPDIPVRSLPRWKTAYPRISKLFEDPPEGLATIEAIYLAHELLGRDTTGLLGRYRWANEFLELNGQKG